MVEGHAVCYDSDVAYGAGKTSGWVDMLHFCCGGGRNCNCLTDCLPYSVENERFGEINTSAASQKIPCHFVQPGGSSSCPEQPDT